MNLFFLFFVIGALTKDYYKIMDVPRSITTKRLEKAYKKKLLSLHPDKFKTEKEKEEAQKQYTLV